MDVKMLRESVKGLPTTSYNLKYNRREFEYFKQQKIKQTFDNLRWHVNLMKIDAKNGFAELPLEEQIKYLDLRIREVKEYLLENAGFYEWEVRKYMMVAEKKIEAIYVLFMEKSPVVKSIMRMRRRKRKSLVNL